MAEIEAGKGLLDTSVLIDPDTAASLPEDGSISSLSLAELAAGRWEIVDVGRATR